MRRGHRGTAVIRVTGGGAGGPALAARDRHRRHDAAARCPDVDRGRTVVREAAELTRAGDRRDTDHVRRRISRRVTGCRLAVRRAVACRGDEQHAGCIRARERIAECLRKTTAAPRIVGGDDRHAGHAQCGEVVHRLDRVGRRAAACAQELCAHQLHAPAHAGHTLAVAANAADGTGDMRAVIVVHAIEDAVVVAIEVPAVHVIHVPVVVVVAAIACDLAGVRADIRGDVLVRRHVAFVDDADVDVAAVLPAVGPCRHGGTAEARVHAPERAIGDVRVIGNHFVVVDPVGLCVLHVGIAAQRLDGTAHIHRRTHQVHALAVTATQHCRRHDLLVRGRARRAHRRTAAHDRGTVAEAHQHLARHELRRGIDACRDLCNARADRGLRHRADRLGRACRDGDHQQQCRGSLANTGTTNVELVSRHVQSCGQDGDVRRKIGRST